MLALFPWASLAGTALVALAAHLLRGRIYAVFVSILLGIHSLIATALAPWVGPLLPAYAVLHALVYVHLLLLVRPRLRPLAYRMLVSIPASWFAAGVFLAMPWAVAVGLGLRPLALAVPFAAAAFGVVQSLWHRFEERHLAVDTVSVAALGRHRPGDHRVARPLRLAQLTDTHLGPFMSERRLRGIVERAVASNPDLVLLTGDFLTMESHHAREALARAFEPLRALEGRVFACLGNHDHEALETVRGALDDCGARLLVDEAVRIETPAGPVQILGLDHHFRGKSAKIIAACAKHPRDPEAFRLVLLHDPGAFKHLPDGDADLVLSGHTHGGQLGLVTLGLPHTFVSAFTSIPDHGLWALGKNRLYVHRGTCHYGFPVRVGVPGEESLLVVHAAT
ncbi:MAG: metallophosphoesterase [Deltaproteobacteria bacterium]|nr:metallophosphoesterase [Deltaproteobacteria bacterium]